MTNTKTTKRALLASVLSIVLCFAMLIGSTFAWFTDTVTTGVNKITAGNLDVGLKYSKDFNTWNNAEAATEIFKKDALWEPGYTEVVYFEVENKGSLAFNYRVGTNLVNNVIGKTQDDKDIDLTKYIKFGIVKVDKAFANRDAALAAVKDSAIDFANLFVAEDSLTTKGATQKFAMVVFMPTTVNNEANHNGKDIPSIEFGVQVIATQKAEEQDSYGKDYDADATYPQFAFAKYEAAKELVLKGEGFEAIIPANAGLETSDDHQDVAANTELVMKIDEADSAPNIEIETGDIVLPYTISLETKDGEAVESTDKSITVKLEIGAGRGNVELYHKTEKVNNATYDSTTGILTFTTNDFSPFTVVEKAAITCDTSWYNETGTEFVLTDAADLFGLAVLVDGGNSFANKTVKLGANIDLEYAEFEAIGSINNPLSASIDGQGYKISNLKITRDNWDENTGAGGKASENRQALISSYTPVGECTIKDLTIENASIIGCRGVGVLIAKSAGGNLTTNTLTVTNIKIIGEVKIACQYEAAAVIGSADALKEISNVTVDVTADSYLSNINSGIKGTAMCLGSIGGWIKVEKATNLKSNLNISGRDGAIGGIFGEVMGQYAPANLSNMYYSGKITAYCTKANNGTDWTNGGLIFGMTHNGLIVGTPRFTVIADLSTCSSTGSLELHLNDAEKIIKTTTADDLGDKYVDKAIDLFGAPYDKNYTNKSFSKSYVAQ